MSRARRLVRPFHTDANGRQWSVRYADSFVWGRGWWAVCMLCVQARTLLNRFADVVDDDGDFLDDDMDAPAQFDEEGVRPDESRTIAKNPTATETTESVAYYLLPPQPNPGTNAFRCSNRHRTPTVQYAYRSTGASGRQ